ncbi:tetratricopeptide repeat protein [Tenacibaculum finnmarkense]|uniref:tetratricopeptide repeat protein n=1 Tax=Tenacibaculum finnmarkense TaxID=2781243 RepID=UPI00187B1819|nr:tetratricopeptide repeat protein [Tenacibaculum finnmarkense]MBE7661286.1 tetratricopeptide repeat protein [Tenacibaculum finnmarkense genomovar finnmarkense]MCG8252853.1 tetratricopeptide repeat protein [Tenacibaculum finnmarkense genomovar finnmarkense]MCG8816329.1 tetratricopeptide repeat protein [Tenacibaculum finnmarkense]MCG8821348.1 tetratricopeptide repeat protein [Tenacibaculum finnmarkense]
MNKIIIIILSILFLQCKGQNEHNIETAKGKKLRQDSLIDTYVTNGAKKFNYKFQMKEWQDKLDKGLKIDSTVAYLWQQKAMPYFKARKYEVGMKYLNKAVLYDSERWLSYRAFIKCIFIKTYKEAIIDFEKCIKMEGNGYVMDHTYKFHIALCNLQLNEFKKAEEIFMIDIEKQRNKWTEAHFLDLFYYGISKYEQGKWEEAITEFNNCLNQYPNFSDAQYYKGICLFRLGRNEEVKIIFDKAKENALKGYTISEDNSVYEKYPYQGSLKN